MRTLGVNSLVLKKPLVYLLPFSISGGLQENILGKVSFIRPLNSYNISDMGEVAKMVKKYSILHSKLHGGAPNMFREPSWALVCVLW